MAQVPAPPAPATPTAAPACWCRPASRHAARPAGPLRLAPPNRNPAPPAAPTLFCWDGNRLLAEQRGDTHQLYLYEPDSFVPLAIVRWKAANADAPHAAGSDEGTRAANGPKPTSHAGTQSTAKATDTDRSPLLPPELLSLKDRYPEQWAKLEAQRRKLARQFGQPPEPEAPTPRNVSTFSQHSATFFLANNFR